MMGFEVLPTQKSADGDVLALCGDWGSLPRLEKLESIDFIL